MELDHNHFQKQGFLIFTQPSPKGSSMGSKIRSGKNDAFQNFLTYHHHSEEDGNSSVLIYLTQGCCSCWHYIPGQAISLSWLQSLPPCPPTTVGTGQGVLVFFVFIILRWFMNYGSDINLE